MVGAFRILMRMVQLMLHGIHVGSSGFGYVTFLPNGNCSLSCRYPTTLKKYQSFKNGTIQGSSSLCNKGQGFYKLPE